MWVICLSTCACNHFAEEGRWPSACFGSNIALVANNSPAIGASDHVGASLVTLWAEKGCAPKLFVKTYSIAISTMQLPRPCSFEVIVAIRCYCGTEGVDGGF